jgi:hypothetical protein
MGSSERLDRFEQDRNYDEFLQPSKVNGLNAASGQNANLSDRPWPLPAVRTADSGSGATLRGA